MFVVSQTIESFHFDKPNDWLLVSDASMLLVEAVVQMYLLGHTEIIPLVNKLFN